MEEGPRRVQAVPEGKRLLNNVVVCVSELLFLTRHNVIAVVIMS